MPGLADSSLQHHVAPKGMGANLHGPPLHRAQRFHEFNQEWELISGLQYCTLQCRQCSVVRLEGKGFFRALPVHSGTSSILSLSHPDRWWEREEQRERKGGRNSRIKSQVWEAPSQQLGALSTMRDGSISPFLSPVSFPIKWAVCVSFYRNVFPPLPVTIESKFLSFRCATYDLLEHLQCWLSISFTTRVLSHPWNIFGSWRNMVGLNLQSDFVKSPNNHLYGEEPGAGRSRGCWVGSNRVVVWSWEAPGFFVFQWKDPTPYIL